MGGSVLNEKKKKPDTYIRGSFALPLLEQGGLLLENLSFIDKTVIFKNILKSIFKKGPNLKTKYVLRDFFSSKIALQIFLYV